MNLILVVDDDSSICKAIAIGLSTQDFEVDVAKDGKGCIKSGTKKPYDILIADLILPDMDGLDVIKEVKRTRPEIISILITASPCMESYNKAINLEVKGYLEKPFGMEDLKNSILRGLEKRNLKRKMKSTEATASEYR